MAEQATEQQYREAPIQMRETNEDRRAARLEKTRQRAHTWRTRVIAEQTLRIREAEAALAALGREPKPLWEPDFTNPQSMYDYAEMTVKDKG